MKRFSLFLVAVLLIALAVNVSAAGRPYNYVKAKAPSGSCVTGSTWTNVKGAAGAVFYRCEASAWVAANTVDTAFTIPNASNVPAVKVNGAGMFYTGAGTPEGSVAAPVGAIFLRTNGGANTCLYIKESGTGTTGWVAK